MCHHSWTRRCAFNSFRKKTKFIVSFSLLFVDNNKNIDYWLILLTCWRVKMTNLWFEWRTLVHLDDILDKQYPECWPHLVSYVIFVLILCLGEQKTFFHLKVIFYYQAVELAVSKSILYVLASLLSFLLTTLLQFLSIFHPHQMISWVILVNMKTLWYRMRR